MATDKWLTANAKKTTDPGKEHLLSADGFKRALPARFHNSLDKDMLDDINELIENTPLRENFRDNLLSFARVLQDGNTKLKDYINAVKYVSYKLMGDSNIAAYTKCFPERYQRMLDEGYDSKTISAHVTGFHKRKIVTKLLEQAMVPTWLLNQDLYQKALNVSADLMMNAKSEKVRADAANNLLTQLKAPEAAKVELDITVKENDAIAALRKSTMELVEQQKKMIESGRMTAHDVANSDLIVEADYEEITE
jgi:hypothetical protein